MRQRPIFAHSGHWLLWMSAVCQERTLLYHYALWSTSEHSPCVVRVVWPKRSCTTLPRGVSDGPVSVHVHRDHTHLHSHQSHGWA